MKQQNGAITYSPTDLVTFVKSPYASWMDRKYLTDPDALTPDEDDPLLSVLARRGGEHEASYVEKLAAGGREVCTISRDSSDPVKDTIAAIDARRQVIFQANLRV